MGKWLVKSRPYKIFISKNITLEFKYAALYFYQTQMDTKGVSMYAATLTGKFQRLARSELLADESVTNLHHL